jgi:hypothetical protein
VKDQPLPTIDEFLLLHGDDPDTTEGPHLITVDELRAAGALDVPAAWRKSLANESSFTLPGFGDDDTNEDTDEDAD